MPTSQPEPTRRALLAGGGALLLGRLMSRGVPHPRARARRLLYLHMAGGPSQVDLFDPKPALAAHDGRAAPAHLIDGERFAFLSNAPRLLGSPFRFARHGQSGQELSELLPELGTVADELCIVRSRSTLPFNHAPAQLMLATGHERVGRPSLGAWLSLGLGSDSPDLPAFVALTSGLFQPSAGHALWGAGFLPTRHQGVRFLPGAQPVPFVADPPGFDRATRRRGLQALLELNARRQALLGDAEIGTRSAQYELAFRMQESVPALCDLAAEPAALRAEYGLRGEEPSFARDCLLARRLLERGVRVVQLHHWGWDSHGTGTADDLVHSLPERCREVDRPCAALLRDLRRRGMLEDTLVVWTGEFGRTPMNEERNGSPFLGRDHHPHAFSCWLAGAGVRAGATVGETDELGARVVQGEIDTHDFNATLLHMMGVDHLELVWRHQGRDHRLTDVAGRVRHELLA